MKTFLEKVEYQQENIGCIPLLKGHVKHGFSWGVGSENMSFSHGPTDNVLNKVEIFLKKLKMGSATEAINMVPQHGDQIVDIDEKFLGLIPNRDGLGRFIECDAFFTRLIKLPLIVKPADCTVSIVKGVDANGYSVVGMIHAGRIGLDISLPQKAINHVINHYGCDLKTLLIGVAPSITADSYFIQNLAELKDLSKWEGYYVFRNCKYVPVNKYYYLDILGNLLRQYNSTGIKKHQLQIYKVDTFNAAAEGHAFSYRYYSFSRRFWPNKKNTRDGRFIVALELEQYNF